MKVWSSEHTFSHPWSTVANAAWRKYPNPLNGAVTGMDVIKQNLEKDGSLRSERIIESHFHIPNWVTQLTGFSGTQYSHELSLINPKKQTMTLESKNLNAAHFIEVHEKLVYSAHPIDKRKTVLKQEAVIRVSLPAFTDYCEKTFLTRYQSNAENGRKGLEWVIQHLKKEYQEFSSKVSSLGGGVQEISDHMFTAFNASKHS